MPAIPAHANALSDTPTDNVWTECIDDAGNLVSGDARIGDAGEQAFDSEAVTMTHAACFNVNANLAACGLWHLTLNKLERPSAAHYLSRPHLRHRPLLVCWTRRTICG
jgi:hypothetical protein